MRFRDYRESGPGMSFHVYNRGNGKMDIFRDRYDYEHFLKRLRTALGKQARKIEGAPLYPHSEFSLLCFCLMPNHFHLQILQRGVTPIGKLLLRVCTSYSMYFNKKYEHVGHVFQDQFKAVPIRSDRQMIAVSAYIHQNPKVAGLVDRLTKWKYGSYPDYVGIRNGDLCDKEIILSQFRDNSDYVEFVESRFASIKEQKEIERFFLN